MLIDVLDGPLGLALLLVGDDVLCQPGGSDALVGLPHSDLLRR